MMIGAGIAGVDMSGPPKEWDGDWRLVDWDPENQISEWYLYDEAAEKIRVRKVQHNTKDILDGNKAERNAMAGSRWGDGKKVATIPLPLFEALGLDDALANKDHRFVRKVLNNSDYQNLRTFDGNL